MTEPQPPQPTGTPDVIHAEQEIPLVCVKFEGTIATLQDDGSIGPPRDSAAGFLTELEQLGYLVVVYSPLLSVPDLTKRTQAASMIEDYLHRNNMPFAELWLQDGVPPASAFVSDDAVMIEKNPYPQSYAAALQMVVQKVPPPAAQQQQQQQQPQPSAPPSGVPPQ